MLHLTVVHEYLIMDCKSVGIDGDALTYLRSYLENRQYCVQIGKSFSDKKTLNRGVPQGSVLGPVLFCIYTIELSYLLKKHNVGFKLFADDTQFYMAVDNIDNTEGKIKLTMDDIGKWMESKQLKLNQDTPTWDSEHLKDVLQGSIINYQVTSKIVPKWMSSKRN